jgi:type I restriction enzyme M protein
MREEQGVEDGLLADANEANEGEPPRITAKSSKEALRKLGDDPDEADARRALKAYRDLLDKQADAKGRLREAEDDLEAKVDGKYPKLTEDAIKTLVVADKWLATLAAAVQGELDRVSQTLTGRIRQLAERYATPLPELGEEVNALAARVDGHLQRMGAQWK